MGWLCHSGNYSSVKDYADCEITGSEKHKLLERSVYGKEVYSLFENVETGMRYIALHLVTRGEGEWCRKDMDESCGPYYYNCPEYILVQSTVTHPTAVEWRELCREKRRLVRDQTEAAKNLKANDVIEYHDKKLTYLYPYNKSGSQIVCRTEDGEVYRYPVKKFKLEWLKPKVAEPKTSESI